jgi:hypothetical protein
MVAGRSVLTWNQDHSSSELKEIKKYDGLLLTLLDLRLQNQDTT